MKDDNVQNLVEFAKRRFDKPCGDVRTTGSKLSYEANTIISSTIGVSNGSKSIKIEKILDVLNQNNIFMVSMSWLLENMDTVKRIFVANNNLKVQILG